MLFLAAAVPLALADLVPAFAALALAAMVIALALAVIDFRATPRPAAVAVERVAEPQLSIGVRNRVTLRVRNPFSRPLRLVLRDTVPDSFDVDRRAIALPVAPGGEADAAYAARPRFRGSFRFGDVYLRLRGPLDLVERQGHVPADAPANVYPDLQEIRRYEASPTTPGSGAPASRARARSSSACGNTNRTTIRVRSRGPRPRAADVRSASSTRRSGSSASSSCSTRVA